MSVKIFISHKQEDTMKAEKVSKYIESKYGFSTYVDTLDDSISPSTNITDRIVGKLRDATHLLVIFSEKTKGSMWVPFELGVSYERQQGIGVLLWAETLRENDLPEYLDAFPKLRVKQNGFGYRVGGYVSFEEDLNKYLDEIKRNPTKEILMESMESLGMRKTASEVNYAREFIDRLNRKLH
jgi:hypothetical protein